MLRTEHCSECGGSGAAKGSRPETCSQCRGTGKVKTTQRTPFGVFSQTGACPTCHGTGKVIKTPCRTCAGKGMVRKNKTISVKIPAGIDNGQTISIRGEGSAGVNGGGRGDIYVTVSVRAHALFRRSGNDIHLDFPISFAQAALGAKLTVPTPEGKIEYDLPEGTQSGSTFRLRGRGIKNINGYGKGDLYVHITVDVPTHLSAKQKELIREFDNSVEEKHYENRRGFFEKMKSILNNK